MDRISNGPPIFGSDGRTIAVTTDEGGRLLDAETGDLSNPLVGCSELRSPQFSPDGTRLVGVCRDIPTEPTVFVYDIYGGLARKLAAHDVTLADMAFGSDGRFASIAQSENGATSTVALWQLDLPKSTLADVCHVDRPRLRRWLVGGRQDDPRVFNLGRSFLA